MSIRRSKKKTGCQYNKQTKRCGLTDGIHDSDNCEDYKEGARCVRKKSAKKPTIKPKIKPVKKPVKKPAIARSTKTITYNWDGGETTRTLHFPGVELSYISPHNSIGIYNEDFSGLNFQDSDLSSSDFYNCDFRKTNMKNVDMERSIFEGSDFRGATGLNNIQKEIIRTSGGILNSRGVSLLKEQHKKLSALASKYHEYTEKRDMIKQEIFELASSNPAHGDEVAVMNTYKL